MRSSDNDYDWLGPGIYFWENNPKRAIDYAHMLQPMEPIADYDIP